MILLHNAFDGVDPASLGALGWAWQLLHVQSPIVYAPERVFFVVYPLIPWIGVMAAGYLFGGILQTEQGARDRKLFALGFGLTGAFLILRGINLYGDPTPWTRQASFVSTVLSFLNCQKYPPSLAYLLITLGPGIAILPVLERWKGRVAEFLTVFGRVPLFYYVIHIYLIHLLAVLAAVSTVGDASFLTSNIAPGTWQVAYGFSLPVVYEVWLSLILLVYFPCRWFAGVKRKNRAAWLSYL
jgi:uncharacterized membrane protein